jgi:ABC-type lipoprotein release transport system permease subunit
MKNYKMAWRNLWRNRRRTIITVASVFFAVFFALIMRSMQLGTYDYMFKNMIESYSGYIQVQNDEFWEDRIVDNAIEFPADIRQKIIETPNVKDIIPRFETFALASSGSRTKGVLVMGIDPEKEKLLSDVEGKLIKYRLSDNAVDRLNEEPISEDLKKNLELFRGFTYASDATICTELGINERDSGLVMPVIRKHAMVDNGYIETGKPGALVGDRLATYLGLSRGDSIVLISQGYHGATAAGIYPVEGIVHLPAPEIEGRIVYLPVDICQELYSAQGLLTSVVLHIDKNDDNTIDQTLASLGSMLGKPYRVLGWKEMNETIVNQMDADNKSGMIMIGILYLVIAFGVFGTVLMMTAERRREFGVLVSIGMQKTKLAAVMVYEMFFIGLLGILAGVAVALPSIIYGFYHPLRFSGNSAKMWEDYGFEPVMAFQWIDKYFLWQSVVVGIIVLIAVLYPVRKIMKLKEVNALKA